MIVRRRGARHLPGLGMVLLAVLSVAACTTSPRTQLSWGVRDHRSVPVSRAQYAARTEYGPRAVKLPPVERQRFVPAEQKQFAGGTPVPAPKPRSTPGWYTASVPQQEAVPQEAVVRGDSSADGTVKFRWPLAGRVLAAFGPTGGGGRNDGINIAAPRGTPVRAAAAGVVSYCGNELKGYGNLVLLRHEGGYITAYAHVDNFIVNRNDHVAAGQVIAYSGATGDVATPQLHFEIRQGVRPVDPRALLPNTVLVASN